jgi:fatty acid-binding protein DegV
LLGAVLSVKPLLHILDGEIAVLERVRTSAKAIARLEDVAALTAANGEIDLAVQHLGAADRAEHVAARLRERIPGIASVHLSELGPVVGAHVGAGTVGVVVHHR